MTQDRENLKRVYNNYMTLRSLLNTFNGLSQPIGIEVYDDIDVCLKLLKKRLNTLHDMALSAMPKPKRKGKPQGTKKADLLRRDAEAIPILREMLSKKPKTKLRELAQVVGIPQSSVYFLINKNPELFVLRYPEKFNKEEDGQ